MKVFRGLHRILDYSLIGGIIEFPEGSGFNDFSMFECGVNSRRLLPTMGILLGMQFEK